MYDSNIFEKVNQYKFLYIWWLIMINVNH